MALKESILNTGPQVKLDGNILRHPTSNRWQLHKSASELFLKPGQERNFQLIIQDENHSIIRSSDQSPPNPEGLFSFRISYAPKHRKKMRNGHYKNIRIDRDHCENWIVDRLGKALLITRLATEVIPIKINRGDNNKIFTVMTGQSYGEARIRDKQEFDRIWNDGIGSAKAYGVGSLEIISQ